jgi:ABC-type transporter Mla maintaining outer membrane lipid asymmetry ATPase subunit MlaF
MTVAENVAFLSKCSPVTIRQIKERVDFVLRVLLDAHNKLPSEISGGMQKGSHCKSNQTNLNIFFVMNPTLA